MTNEGAALELNASMRRLIETVRTVDPAAEADLVAATELIRQVDALLGTHVVEGTRMQAFLKASDMTERMEAAKDGLPFYDGRPINEIFKYSPVTGPLNPISAPAELTIREGDPFFDIVGRGLFPSAHCGPPDSVHGGFVAAVLDEMLGAVCMCNDLGGFTGTLNIKYRSPTPLDAEITLLARVTGTERRKVFASGTMHHGETLLAEADGIFIRNAAISEVS